MTDPTPIPTIEEIRAVLEPFAGGISHGENVKLTIGHFRKLKDLFVALSRPGLVVVPRKPTEAMICAGDGEDVGFGSTSARVYRAMIAAATNEGE